MWGAMEEEKDGEENKIMSQESSLNTVKSMLISI